MGGKPRRKGSALTASPAHASARLAGAVLGAPPRLDHQRACLLVCADRAAHTRRLALARHWLSPLRRAHNPADDEACAARVLERTRSGKAKPPASGMTDPRRPRVL